MANTGKQSPLGINVLGSLLQNQGFYINPTAESYMGSSKSTNGNYTLGKIIADTSLKWLTYAINDSYKRGAASQADPLSPSGSATVDSTTYNNLLNIGQSRIPALGNSPPPTWETSDPGGVWKNQHTDYVPPTINRFSREVQAGAPATSGYGFYNWNAPVYNDENNRLLSYQDEGQLASWYPFLSTVEDPDNPGNYYSVTNRAITQWGWIRCMALQAWNEFNWNGETLTQLDNIPIGSPVYKDFTESFLTCDGFLNYSNEAIYAIEDSQTFLKGTFSNQDDLISADIAGVSLSSRSFGQDLINLGKALDLSTINKFGLPSTLLQNLQKNNSLTQSLILALLTAGLSQNDINQIAAANITPTKDQEQKIYAAFLVLIGSDLKNILITLNCKTKGLNALSDLLSVKKIFPLSFTTLTVPVYNTSPGPTNSKTYYLLFIKQELNPQLIIPKIKEIVGTIIPPEPPPLPEPLPLPSPVIEEQLVIEAALPIVPPPAPTPDIPIPPVVQPPPVTVPVYPPPSPPPPAIPPSTGGGGGCVVLDAYLPAVETRLHNSKSIERAWQIENDFDILLADEQLKSTKGKVVKAMIDFQPCVKIVTASGIRLSCSTTAPILTKNKGYVEAPKLFGEQIAVMRNDIAFYDEVVGIEDIGYKHVRVIDTGDNSFWAGDIQNAYVLHHNARISDALDYDKK